MEVRNLVTFLKVTELKSFSRAAEALDYSQSAVTVQIQQLERELGVQLFDRIGKTVSITQYGKDFVSYARDVVSACQRLCLVGFRAERHRARRHAQFAAHRLVL